MVKTDLFDRFSRHSPQAAVVSGPVAAVPQLRAGQLLGAGQQGLPRLFRQGLQLPGEELLHPGAGKLSRRLHRRGRRGGLILPATKKAGRRPLGWRPCLYAVPAGAALQRHGRVPPPYRGLLFSATRCIRKPFCFSSFRTFKPAAAHSPRTSSQL